ncbi:hypothetical protein AGR7C_Cc140096 [Agrobacterium deltaense Zutra 3/1]|uniref:Molybdopterin oxidoreductase domain-containing protein n=1 Tax=Agrobacterium deltaense Zutra 3/1 TaxID=1183427 RepID=A0A1S7PD19_9HYPH|nr:hypothetical protein AGR7C_Cc140096 [Agrobacterium deltaense Zutra 3/1]
MSKTDFIGKASTAAGGWGALKSVGKRLLESGAPISGARTLLKTNQPDGFDCPGCAWGDPEHGSSFEFCENGVKAVSWEATEARVPPDFFASRTVSELRGWSDYDLEKQGRLTHPMRYDRASDRYLPVSWDDAFAEIGRILNSLDSPDRAEFYTSGRASNEAAFLYQLMVRLYGTNNFPDCSNMCHEASGVGLKASIGVGKGTVLLEDFEQTDAIFVIGQNPGTNHPRMLGDLRRAALRGARIAVFNPIREKGSGALCRPAGQGGDDYRRQHPHRHQLLPAAPGRRHGGRARHEQGGLRRRRCRKGSGRTRHHRLRLHRRACGGVRGLSCCRRCDELGKHPRPVRPHPRGDRGSRPYLHECRFRHRHLGHGRHPAQAFGHHRSRDHQFHAAARQYRPSGRRPLPGARPFQRAGRPHRRYRRKSPARTSRRAGKGTRRPHAAKARPQYRRSRRRDAGRQGSDFHRPRR